MAELAIAVADEYQRLGLGSRLTEMLLEFAQEKKFASVYAIILPENSVMIRMATKFGFKVRHADEAMIVVERPLRQTLNQRI
jgi:acetyltransferase